MEKRISDYCNNCKQKKENLCEGSTISCDEYDPIVPNKYAPKSK